MTWAASRAADARHTGKNGSIAAGLSNRVPDFANSILKSAVPCGGFYGRNVKFVGVVVEPAYTSQRCCACGHTERCNRRSQAEFWCVVCGHASAADYNTAINVERTTLSAGLWCTAPCVGVLRHKPSCFSPGLLTSWQPLNLLTAPTKDGIIARQFTSSRSPPSSMKEPTLGDTTVYFLCTVPTEDILGWIDAWFHI